MNFSFSTSVSISFRIVRELANARKTSPFLNVSHYCREWRWYVCIFSRLSIPSFWFGNFIPGSPYIAIGASGGPTIFPAVFQTLINIIDYELDPSEAIEFGRLHNQLKPEGTYADETYRADILEALSRRRHHIEGEFLKLWKGNRWWFDLFRPSTSVGYLP